MLFFQDPDVYLTYTIYYIHIHYILYTTCQIPFMVSWPPEEGQAS